MGANNTLADQIYLQHLESLPDSNGFLLLLAFLASAGWVLMQRLTTFLTARLATRARNQQDNTNADMGSDAAEPRRWTETPARYRGPTTSTPLYPEGSHRPATPALSPPNNVQPDPCNSTPAPAAHYSTPTPATANLNPYHEYLSSTPGPALANQRPSTYSPQNQLYDISSYQPNSRRKERVPEAFSEAKVKFKDWLFTFNALSRLNGWTEAEKGAQMTCLLRGNAQQVLQDLSPEDRENYQRVVEALKRRFDPEEKKGLKKQDSEGGVAKAVKELSNKGYHQLKAQPLQRSPHQPLLPTPRHISRCQGCNQIGHESRICPRIYRPNAHNTLHKLPDPRPRFEREVEGHADKNCSKPRRPSHSH